MCSPDWANKNRQLGICVYLETVFRALHGIPKNETSVCTFVSVQKRTTLLFIQCLAITYVCVMYVCHMTSAIFFINTQTNVIKTHQLVSLSQWLLTELFSSQAITTLCYSNVYFSIAFHYSIYMNAITRSICQGYQYKSHRWYSSIVFSTF